MPELPEVETVRKTLELKLKNKKIKSINILYHGIFADANIEKICNDIKEETINNILRKGKWLIFELDHYYLLSHLRMEGKYLYRDFKDKITKHEHVIFNIADEFELRYQDTRKFGKMHLIKKSDIGNEDSPISKLGLEPWDDNLTVNYLTEKFKNKRTAIKTILLDQTIISGIGNIYANEILFLSKINPHKESGKLTSKEKNNIIINTRDVLSIAIEMGGTTIRSYTSQEGVTGLFQQDLYVQDRENEPCKVCKTNIVREKLNGRSAFYCPNCQK